jgi:NAD(P)-dependent dehydrogenase (short-subunit alcohol dehydrogenase family)
MTTTERGVGAAFDLSGRAALITGASRGLGRVLALAFADAGARLAITARSKSDLEGVADEIADRTGHRPFVFTADQMDDDQVAEGVRAAQEALGGIDILVNNAGEPIVKPFVETDVAEFARILDVNLMGPVRFISAVAPAMLERERGRILNIGSVDSVVGAPNMSAYCASKGGLGQLTRALGVEWARRGVRVNALCPGTVRTSANEEYLEDPVLREKIARRTPVHRYAEPEEMVPLALYLCSDFSDFVTGALYLIDGGRTAV